MNSADGKSCGKASATEEYTQAVPVPIAMSVCIVALRCRTLSISPAKNWLPEYARTANDARPIATQTSQSCWLPRGRMSARPGMSHGYERSIVGPATAAPNHHLRMSRRYSRSLAAASLSLSAGRATAAARSGRMKSASAASPASSAAASRWRSPDGERTSTLTRLTSTPMSPTTPVSAATSSWSRSTSTVARSVTGFTYASAVPGTSRMARSMLCASEAHCSPPSSSVTVPWGRGPVSVVAVIDHQASDRSLGPLWSRA